MKMQKMKFEKMCVNLFWHIKSEMIMENVYPEKDKITQHEINLLCRFALHTCKNEQDLKEKISEFLTKELGFYIDDLF